MKIDMIIRRCWLMVIWWDVIFGQVYLNLVKNPSFEETTVCPKVFPLLYNGDCDTSFVDTPCPTEVYGSICKCKYWFRPILAQTPDYFNSCANIITPNHCKPDGIPRTGVPSNHFGFQFAHRGNAYVGGDFHSIINSTYNPGCWKCRKGYREYIKGCLKEPLSKDKLYCVSMYVSRSDACAKACNNLGFYFSNDSIILSYPPNIGSLGDSILYYTNVVLDTVPICYNHPYIVWDDTGWTKIEGICSPPRGGERFITIGNFFSDIDTKDSCVKTGFYQNCSNINNACHPSYVYYFIDDVSVTELHPAKAASQPSYTICPGQPIVLGTDTTEDAEYAWFPPTALSCTNCAHPVASPTTSITYVLSKKQCKVTTTDMVQIIVEQQPAFISIPKDHTKCPADTITLNLNAPNTISLSCTPTDYLYHPTTYEWNFYPPQSNFYVFEQNWCNVSKRYDTLKIEVKPCEEMELPNVFTPNEDGVNDSWHIVWKEVPVGIKDFKVEIYDRWGLKVYESDRWDFKWDGKHCRNVKLKVLEEECTTGTYYYIIRYDWNEKEREWKGYLTLLR